MAKPLDEHIPVLAQTLLEHIKLPANAVIIDATIGYGGHSLLFGRQLGAEGTILGLDVDDECIKQARTVLAELTCKVILVRENFAAVEEVAAKSGLKQADFILADLGFCSGQIENVKRGLSFQKNMPLDMRLDSRLKTTAADIVNKMDEKALAELIFRFGQERFSRRIARFIVHHRRATSITTTGQLATVVCKALGQSAVSRKSKIHPATRTFQALRIAVNNELENLETFLDAAPNALALGGKIAVISFHSLEDKLVKENFRKNHQDGIYKTITKKPLTASREEIERNPRARSAKLRIAQKIEMSK
jgi:16S rRNA (cytosine1402-N4)-methyltransferase